MSNIEEKQLLLKEVVDAKNHYERQFNHLTNNFYILRAALRYFAVKKGMSFTASKISDNFPVNAAVAGSSLKILTELGVIDNRSSSSSPNRYMPQTVDLERMDQIGEILLENHEITEFR